MSLHTWLNSKRSLLSCPNWIHPLHLLLCTQSPHSITSKCLWWSNFFPKIVNVFFCFSAHCATFSAASRQYACGFADSSLHLWSLSARATTTAASSLSHVTTESHTSHSAPDHKVLLGHHGPVYGACFSSNGQFLLSTSEDCTVRLWNIQKRSSVVSYRGHAYPVWDTAFR